MFRLNDRAYNILKAEIKRLADSEQLAGVTQLKIILEQLKEMRSQKGEPATETELSHIFTIYPYFSDRIINKAARANQQKPLPLYLKIIPIAAAGVASLAGIIWIVNLPYPMIRRPVAKTAPILLLPSYMSMDRNYREAISNVEEAEQLVNRSTSDADITLGEKKVRQAQKNLDALPVWFLGYEPQFYCTFFSCNWRFTFDEFEIARKRIGRMKGVVFQEKNALTALKESEIEIASAKQEYQNASAETAKQNAIDSWQEGIDKLDQLPPSTLAGKQSKTKLKAYRRDFEKVVGYRSGNERTDNIIRAAQQFASKAKELGDKPPHQYYVWEQKEKLWADAIRLLEKVPLSHPGYVQAQTLLAEYKSNLAEVRIDKQKEADSLAAFKEAQRKIEQLLANANYSDPNRIISQLQAIIARLETVEPQTTAYPRARQLLSSAKQKLTEFQK